MQLSLPVEDNPLLPRIYARLLAAQGPQRDAERHDPVSQLVKAMVSSKTNDAVAGPAFERLRERFCPSEGNWDRLRTASPAEIEALIQPVQFAKNKAPQICQTVRMIVARNGELNLDFLADWDDEMAFQWLDSLPGVGAKIAATTLNFSTLRKRTMSVDTHLLRLGERVGFVPPGADFPAGYEAYMRLLPDDWDADALYELHWLMKYHAQSVCTDLRPTCGPCMLRDLCRHGLQRQGSEGRVRLTAIATSAAATRAAGAPAIPGHG